MDNHEEILDALTAFGKSPNPPQEIPSVLEQYLNFVAKNGETLFPWSQLKPLILKKMELVFTDLRQSLGSENIPNRPNVENVRFDVIHARIIDSLHKFNGAPFTIQRLCELLLNPKKHYKRSDKFMRGLEKNVLVVSTVDPFGRKVVCESGNKPMMNGILDINGSSHPLRDTGLSIPLPPVPGWVTTSATSITPPVRSGGTMPSLDSKAGTNMEGLGKDASVVSNSMSGGMAVSGSVFSDQGDPLAVHSEEVVEETVVTMDTGEVTSVVTDGGEGMAEREAMEGDMADDREASSFSSSSSSSSEELSTSSESVENGQRVSPFGVAGNSFNDEAVEEASLDENRPWAAFAQEVKQEDAALQPSLDNQSAENLSDENQTSGVSSSSPHHTSPEALPSSSSSSAAPPSPDTPQSSSSSATTSSKVEDEKNDSRDLPTDKTPSDQTGWLPPDVSCAASLGFEPDNSASDHTVLKPEDGANSPSFEEQDKQASSTTTAVTTTTNNTSDPNTPVSSSSSSSSSSLSSSSGSVPTYAQVVASSTDKTIHLAPYDSSDPIPCDSVAGLERLVGSMEQSLSSSSSSSSSPSPSSSTSITQLSSSSSSPSSFSHPAGAQDINSSSVTTSWTPSSLTGSSQQALTSSSSDRCFSEGEPASKRLRLSTDEVKMEEECISTSSDTCMEEGGGFDQTQDQGHKQSTVVHSSMEGEAQEQDGSQREADSAEVGGQGEMMDEGSSAGLDSTVEPCPSKEEITDSSVDSSDREASDGMDTCVNEEEEKNSVSSNVEPSAVSTTDLDVGDQPSSQPVDN